MQTVDPSTQLTLVQWAIDKGGAYVVILVVLFFYRRDWQTAVNFWKDQSKITVDLIIEATKAQDATAAALAQNTVVVHQAKRVMEIYLSDIPFNTVEAKRKRDLLVHNINP